MSVRTIAIAALGCRVNQAEMEDISDKLSSRGYRPVEFGCPADVYVINTCTVTHIADRKSRQIIRQARRASPEGLLVVTGCYAQAAPAEVRSLGVDLVIGNTCKDELAEIIAREVEARGIVPSLDHTFVPQAPSRTRAFVKIQDGCQHFCTFCIIPYTRGPERSVPPEGVMAMVRAKLAAGHREIVLTGIQIGAYGRDLRKAGYTDAPTLAGLVQRILNETSLERLRLSSLEPEYFEPLLLELFEGDQRLCRHLHLPAQSGSDPILKRMGRRYSRHKFLEMVDRVRQAIPDVAIATDIMVGFPGETEEDFEASCSLIQEVGFSKVHAFRYSPRPGTPAARMPGQVKPETIAKRIDRVIDLAEGSAQAYRQCFLGRVITVLYEDHEASLYGEATKLWTGLTNNYIRVYTPSDRDLNNAMGAVVLVGEHKDGLWGQLVGE